MADNNPYLRQLQQLREKMAKDEKVQNQLLSLLKLSTTGIDYMLKANEILKPAEPTEDSEIAAGLVKHIEAMFKEYGRAKEWTDISNGAKDFKEQDLESKKAFLQRITDIIPNRDGDAGGAPEMEAEV